MAAVKNTKKPARRSSGNNRKKKTNKKESRLYLLTLIAILAVCIVTATICIATGCGEESGAESVYSVYSESSDALIDNESSASESVDSESKTEESSKEEENSKTEESSKPDESSKPEESSKPDESSEPDESSKSDENSTPEQPVFTQREETKLYEQFIGKDYVIDMNEYEDFVCPDNEAEYVYIVNPAHPLASDYVPDDLVKCTSMRKGRPEYWSYMNRVANEALEAFLAEAAYYGFDDITVTNAYRSYSSQKSLFEQYCKKEIESGKFATEEEAIAHVLTYSTRPGTSEHQSGLCCDMHNRPATNSSFNNTPEAIWLAENAHRFGFILRYPEGKQHITGIKHESWHFRYVGRTAATEMYKLGITLDEYLADEEAAEQ